MIPSPTGLPSDRSKAGLLPSAVALGLLFALALAGAASATAVSFDDAAPAAETTSATIRLAQAQPAAPSPQPARPATPAANAPAASANDEPIGNVATLTGSASVTRNNQAAVPLKLKDDIYLNDVVQTAASSTLGVTFNDETTFNLTANASITIDNFVYENGGKKNSALFDVTKGTVAFVASAVAKTGDMKITTPTSTLGIRGTTGLVEVNGTSGGANNIKLYPDSDGHVGTIDVRDRSGARLGTLTQGSSGFSLRSGPGGRITAAPLAISPQQAARDQGIVRQVHAAQMSAVRSCASSARYGRPIRTGRTASGRIICSSARAARSNRASPTAPARIVRVSPDRRAHRTARPSAGNGRSRAASSGNPTRRLRIRGRCRTVPSRRPSVNRRRRSRRRRSGGSRYSPCRVTGERKRHRSSNGYARP